MLTGARKCTHRPYNLRPAGRGFTSQQMAVVKDFFSKHGEISFISSLSTAVSPGVATGVGCIRV